MPRAPLEGAGRQAGEGAGGGQGRRHDGRGLGPQLAGWRAGGPASWRLRRGEAGLAGVWRMHGRAFEDLQLDACRKADRILTPALAAAARASRVRARC